LDALPHSIGFLFFGLGLTASPWLLGAAIAYHVTLQKARNDWRAPISIGIGGYLGYLMLAGVIWSCEKFAVNILNPTFVFALAAITWVYVLYLLAVASKGGRLSCPDAAKCETSAAPPSTRISRCSFLFGSLLLATLLFYSVFHHSLLPLHAWDALDLWGPQAAEIIELQDHEQVFENRYYHPQTLSIILAWSAYASALVSTATGQWPWLLSTLSIAFIVFGYSRWYEQSRLISALTAYMVTTVPLLENHSYLVGYGEVFVSTALIGSCVLIDTAIQNQRIFLGLIGCFLAFSIVSLKNVGPFYFAIILSSYFLILAFSKSRAFGFLLIALAGSLILYVFHVGISFQLITQRFSVNPDEEKIIFAGKLLTIISVETSHIFKILVTALFYNNSFGILPHIFVVTTIFSLSHRSLRVQRSPFFLLVIILGVCGITGSLYTDYGFQHAVPDNDTGNSRFMLPIMMLSALLVAPSLYGLNRKFSTAEG